jgi:hypothetical protein
MHDVDHFGREALGFPGWHEGAPMTDQSAPLTWEVYVTALEPTASDDPPPGAQEVLWQPIAATLISGQQDAVLVDPLLTVGQARDLVADWVAAHDKNLTAVYITHGHGDHWLGLGMILERFPQARALALPGVIKWMRQGSTPELLAFWNGLLPGKLSEDLVLADPLPDHTIDLEGHDLVAVQLGHTDADDTTAGGSGSPPWTPSSRWDPQTTARSLIHRQRPYN